MTLTRTAPRRSSRSAVIAVACIAATVGAARARPAEEYDLARTVAEAATRSETLRAARSRQDAADARSGESAAVRWPVLAARVSYDWASRVNRIDVPGAAGPHTIEFGDGHTALASLGVDVPLYAGGTLSARAGAASADARAAAYDVASDSLAVVRDARAAFFRALGAEASARAAGVAVRRLRRHHEKLESQLRVGAASREAVVQTLSRLRQAEQQEEAAGLAAETARLDLGRAVGRPGDAVAPRGDLGASLLAGVPVDTMTAESRPELAALRSRGTGADLRARAARGAYLPEVRATAAILYGRPGVEVVQNDWMSWESAGVRLTWPLWDRGARRLRVQEASAASRALDAERDSVHRRLAHALGAARARVASAERQAAKAEERVRLEQERLKLTTGRYEQGMAREDELLDAHDDLAAAEASAAATRAALRLAEVDLLYAVSR
jgi:outer membrane protein TolC